MWRSEEHNSECGVFDSFVVIEPWNNTVNKCLLTEPVDIINYIYSLYRVKISNLGSLTLLVTIPPKLWQMNINGRFLVNSSFTGLNRKHVSDSLFFSFYRQPFSTVLSEVLSLLLVIYLHFFSNPIDSAEIPHSLKHQLSRTQMRHSNCNQKARFSR